MRRTSTPRASTPFPARVGPTTRVTSSSTRGCRALTAVETETDGRDSLPAASAQRRAAVIYNPVKVDAEELKAAVAAEPATAGWADTLWYETTEEDPGTGQARQAIEAGADMVIAAGGDGTIRAVAQELGGTTTSLALLPSGTGNLLARNLDLTLDDMDHSIQVAFDGIDRKIDLAWADIRRDGWPGGAGRLPRDGGFRAGRQDALAHRRGPEGEGRLARLRRRHAQGTSRQEPHAHAVPPRSAVDACRLGAHPHRRQLRLTPREHPAAPARGHRRRPVRSRVPSSRERLGLGADPREGDLGERRAATHEAGPRTRRAPTSTPCGT